MKRDWYWEEFITTMTESTRYRYRNNAEANNHPHSWLFLENTERGWKWWSKAGHYHYIAAENLEEAKALALVEWRMS